MQHDKEAILLGKWDHLFLFVDKDQVQQLDQLLDSGDLVGMHQLEFYHWYHTFVGFSRLRVGLLSIFEKNLDAPECVYQVLGASLPVDPLRTASLVILQVSTDGLQILIFIREEIKVIHNPFYSVIPFGRC